ELFVATLDVSYEDRLHLASLCRMSEGLASRVSGRCPQGVGSLPASAAKRRAQSARPRSGRAARRSRAKRGPPRRSEGERSRTGGLRFGNGAAVESWVASCRYNAGRLSRFIVCDGLRSARLWSRIGAGESEILSWVPRGEESARSRTKGFNVLPGGLCAESIA